LPPGKPDNIEVVSSDQAFQPPDGIINVFDVTHVGFTLPTLFSKEVCNTDL
jgi:hypothetical protein